MKHQINALYKLANICFIHPLYGLSILLAICGTTQLHALPEDASQPINIIADNFEFNQTEGWGEYRGNVEATQGSLKVTADILTVTLNKDGGFSKIEATGKPVNFSMQNKPNEPRMIGIGQKLIYRVAKKELEVITNAKVSQGTDQMTGNLILYNIATTALIARNQGKGRVTVRLTPKPSK